MKKTAARPPSGRAWSQAKIRPSSPRSIFDRSGSFRTYEFHRSLIRDGDGKPAGMRMVCVDVTETARALEEARRARQWLESALASLPKPSFSPILSASFCP